MEHEFDLPVRVPRNAATHIRVSVRYDKGGMCYATYKHKPRGYYLTVGALGKETSPHGIATETWGLFSAHTMLIEEAKRLSRARLEALFAEAKRQIAAKSGAAHDALVAKLQETGLELA